MKKHFLVFLNASFSLVAFAQQLPYQPFTTPVIGEKKLQKSAVQVPQLSINYNWDDQIDTWEMIGDSTFKTYDGLGNVLSEIWVTNYGEDPERYKSEYAYDILGNMTMQINYKWNSLTNVWDEEYKTDIYTSALKDSLVNTSYRKVGSEWVQSNVFLSVRNFTNNKLAKRTDLAWFEHLNAIRPLYTIDYLYTNDTLTKANRMIWDTIQNSYKNNGSLEYIGWHTWNGDYSNSLAIQLIDYSWNQNQWEPSRRISYNYSEKDELIEEKLETYYNSNWVLNYTYKYDFIYNSNNALVEWIWSNLNGNDFEPVFKTTYSNFTLVNSLSNVNQNGKVKPFFYPNPAQTSIQLNQPIVGEYIVKLFSLSGKLLATINSEVNTITLDRSLLTSGLYLYQIILPNGETSTGKILLYD